MTEAILHSLSPRSITMEWRLGQMSGIESMAIGGDYPETPLAEELFHSIGLLHIISPFLPDIISSDFPVFSLTRQLADELYKSQGRPKPDWKTPSDIKPPHSTQVASDHSVVTFSGGKDSLWNLLYASEQGENPSAVHIKGLNEVVGSREYGDVIKQQREIGFPLCVIELTSSYSQKAYSAMNTRDLFLTAVSIPIAERENASKIYLEGSFKEGEAADHALFAHRLSTWEQYGQALKQIGIPIQMVGTNRGEINSIRDLLEKQPNWLPLVSNCVAGEKTRELRRGKYKSIAPSFPFYENQCGGCLKCMTLNVARIAYDPSVAKVARSQDINNYLRDGAKWLRENRVELGGYIDPLFEPLLTSLL